MNAWLKEIKAVLRKEIQSELRSKSGMVTVSLFSLASVIAISFAAFGEKLSGDLSAGLLWVTLLFASTIALPRTFLVEEEQNTADLLRLTARPHALFWGKALYNLGFILITGVALSLLFFMLTGGSVKNLPLYASALIGGCVTLAGTGTLSGALVAQAANRSYLAGAIAIPLLLPMLALGVGAMRVALGVGVLETGWNSAIGIACYGVASFAIGPSLFAAIWRN